MTRILITGCGGPASIGVTRSLQRSGRYELVGTDANLVQLSVAETPIRYHVPPADDVRYLAVLNRIIEAEGIDFVHAQPDPEVAELSRYRDRVNARLFLPPHETVELCQDKYKSYERWAAAGIHVPHTILIGDESGLHEAFARFGPPFWIRATTGAAGRASFIVRDFGAARSWIENWHGWGTFAASELLPGRLLTWQSLWRDGKLVCAQSRERLAWAMGNRSPTGVTGVTGIAKTVSRTDLDEIAQRAILAVDAKPHGIFGVDLKEGADGIPRPTEINIGRFFTTIQFFTELGLNMPELYVRIGLGEEVSVERPINPLPVDVYWIRSMDTQPRLLRSSDIPTFVKGLGETLPSLDLRPDATVFYE
jgi:carbamoyl-phosphate synthase large subunit